MNLSYNEIGSEIDRDRYLKESLRTLQKYRHIVDSQMFPEGSPSIYYERKERLAEKLNQQIEKKKAKKKKYFDKYFFPVVVTVIGVLLTFLLPLLLHRQNAKISQHTEQQQHTSTPNDKQNDQSGENQKR